MDKEIRILFDALLDFLNVKENYVPEDGFSISDTVNDVFGAPYIRELTIKLRYVDKEALKAYRDEKGTTKEG